MNFTDFLVKFEVYTHACRGLGLEAMDESFIYNLFNIRE